jgi:hypothetical protein
MPRPPFTTRIRYALHLMGQRQRAMTGGQRRAIAFVLSVLIAFLLWFTFSLREQYTVVVEMPIEIGRLPEDQALGERPPPFARVAVQGVGLELMKLRRNPPPLVVNPTGVQVDLFAVASESPRLPAGVVVQSVSPSVITLTLDPRMTRRLPIKLVNEIEPALDYDFIGIPRLSPDSVTVTGSRRLVLPMETFPTAPLEASGVRETVSVRLPLSDSLRGLVRTDVLAIDVTVPVGPFTEGRREIEVVVEGAPEGHQVGIRPPRVGVIFRVPLEQYQRAMRATDFYAFVPYESVMADTTGVLLPIVQLPPDLTIRDVRLDPRRVSYWLRVE